MNTNDQLIDGHFSSREVDHDDGILKILAVLWTRKHWVLLAALLFAAAGLVAALSQVPQFQASALVQLETKSSGVQLSADIADLLSSESEAVTELEILKSRLVLGHVAEKEQLDIQATVKALPVFGQLIKRLALPKPSWAWLEGYGWSGESIVVDLLEMPEQWIGVPIPLINIGDSRYKVILPDDRNLQASLGQRLVDESTGFALTVNTLVSEPGTAFTIKRISPLQATTAIRSGLTVSESPRGSGIIRIAMISPNATQSERIVAAIVDAYVAQNIGRSAEEAERSLMFLEEQLPLVQQRLRAAEGMLNDFRLESESIDLNYEAQSILERTVSLDSQLSALSLEETDLSRRYTPNHPTYLAFLEKKARLLAEKDAVNNSVQNLPGTQQEILRKTRDVDVNQQIYLQLLNKSQELRVMRAGAVGNVRLIDQAAANPIAVKPKVPLMIAIGALLGAVLAAGLIVLRQNLYKEIDTPDDLSSLGIPTLAVVPLSQQQLKITRRSDNAILAQQRPMEMAIEAVRGLRTNLHTSLYERERNVIAITGPSPSIGKSFISTNLAFLMASTGAKVLVIDADMRRGNLGKHFKVPEDLSGLTQYLDGSRKASTVMYEVDLETLQIVNAAKKLKQAARPLEQVMHDLGPETDFDSTYLNDDARAATASAAKQYHRRDSKKPTRSITVIPRGQIVSNPSELLMHKRLPELLEYASQHFDLVIIDTPPVLAATDATIVGRYADVNLMVVRHGETTIHEAEEVARTFRNNKSSINGIVLNGYESQRGRYGKYGTHYGYRYAYD